MSTTVIKGPCQVIWGGITFLTQGAVTVTNAPESFDISTDAYGHHEQRMKAKTTQISFTPSGAFDEVMTPLLAAAARMPGNSVLGGTLVIKPFISPQKVHTFLRVGITGLPALNLGASKTLGGQITFTAIPAAESSDGIISGNSPFSAISGAPAHIFTEPWTGNYGVDPFVPDAEFSLSDMETEDGWTISSEMSTDMCRADSAGIVDILQTSLKVTAACKPVGLDEARLSMILNRDLLGPGNLLPGMSYALYPLTAQLELTSRSGHVITLRNCGISAGVQTWGASENRFGTLTFTGIRKWTAGVCQPLLTFALPTP